MKQMAYESKPEDDRLLPKLAEREKEFQKPAIRQIAKNPDFADEARVWLK